MKNKSQWDNAHCWAQGDFDFIFQSFFCFLLVSCERKNKSKRNKVSVQINKVLSKKLCLVNFFRVTSVQALRTQGVRTQGMCLWNTLFYRLALTF